ncbi:hypothetical protein AAJ76_710008572 [Vairimorpha ceranae]|nr:hypothetical protein AAJ76_710008572 [Vairimorpha ceranae]KAF5139907.1 hypothetical protein G9O61_00g019260 [Vairimorpha ceranae]KKO74442.1 hypothetical protein AAJ76_710008572 [Vairimorpha ceranae]
MFKDSFALVNILYPNKPLTIFNASSKDVTVPLRLTEIDRKNFTSQLFMIRFNYKNDFWLTNIYYTNYRSINASPYLVGKSNMPNPNMKLVYLDTIDNNRIFKIMSNYKCMTVGDENTNGKVFYYPLQFEKCTNTASQEFTFVPRIVVEDFLQNTNIHNVNEKEIQRSLIKLDNILKIGLKSRKELDEISN